IKASWTAPADEFVTSGGKIEVQFKKSADSVWDKLNLIDGAETFVHILEVEDGVAYDVRARSINTLGVKSDTTDPWAATVAAHVVVGKTAVPADVASLAAQQNGNVVTFKWPQVADVDLAGYEIRYMAAPFVWDDAIVLTAVTRGTLITNAGLPPGTWTVGIKAKDTSGNFSANAATANITVSNQNDIVISQVEHPRWPGSLTDFVKHDVSDRLVPRSLNVDAGDGVFSQMVRNPVAIARYEAGEIDLGFDADQVRVYAEMSAALGPGEAGVADPLLEIDFRDDAQAYDGFEDWTVGTADFRFLKARARIETATGTAYLERFKVIADVAERTERGEGVVIAVGGTAITFVEQFHTKPNVQVTPDGTAPRFALKSSVTVTGFTAQVFDDAGTDVGGVIDWEATGT
ncbi:MAG: hypothetical protein IIA44_09380, partial [Acidobacteria bacterium]|nr:hypothetical protein [Acidobacteriota bacterium]